MPVLSVERSLEAPSLTVTAEFAAPVQRVWRLYSEAEQLQRHWGPPGWPATFLRHDFEPGGGSHYLMAGPDGERAYGVWRVVEVDEPRSFVVEDAFADADGVPNEEMGWMRMTATLTPVGERTRVVLVSRFRSAEHLQQMLDMGMEEGLRLAMGQIDGILAADGATA